MTLFATTVTELLAERLRGATAAVGYASDVGRSVHVGRTRAGAVEAPCSFVTPGFGAADGAYFASIYTRRIEIRAFVDANTHPELSDPDLCDQIIWDVRRILEDPSARPIPGLDGLKFISDAPGYREDGGTLVGALLTYEVRFIVDLTDPHHSL